MSNVYETRKSKAETRFHYDYTLIKIHKRVARFNVPIQRKTAFNGTYTFTAYAIWRDLGFNPDIFETETSD